MARHPLMGLAAALVLLQAPLWLNPGYFSHDELQWAARSAVASPLELPWVSFHDFTVFQYRPLTFNLWLLASQQLFGSPRLFHLLFVLLGTANACLLARLVRRADPQPQVAIAAGLVFALSPYGVWVHGWVGCLADLLWVGCLLLLLELGWVLLRPRSGQLVPGAWWQPAAGHRLVLAGLAGFALTAVALMAKEAALAIPIVLGVASWLLRLPRIGLAMGAGSGAAALAYLLLRAGVLLHPDQGSSYVIDLGQWPLRWLEYQVFPWAFGVREAHVLALASLSRWLLLLAGLLAWVVWLAGASWRLWLFWLAGGIAALFPVLVLPYSANQYGYGFMALMCGVAALSWSRSRGRWRLIVWALAVATVGHGFQIQGYLYQVGRIQAVFSPGLAAVLRGTAASEVRIWPEDGSQVWTYARLTHDIPSYRGIEIGARVRVAGSPAEATHRVTTSGEVLPFSRIAP